MMEAEGAASEEFIVAALLHDVGKILLLTDEPPENVVCDNFPIGDHPDGIGLDEVTFQWNHDEFGYLKLKDHLPNKLARLIRYHSINPTSLRLMNSDDVRFYESHLRPFRRYDKLSKSIDKVPIIDVDRHLKTLDKWIPGTIDL